MANRNWASGGKIYSMHVMPVILDCNIVIGATGAVASFRGSAIASVTRTGTGLYTINLQDNYNGLFMASGSVTSPVSGLSGTPDVEIANTASTTVTSLTAPSLSIKTLSAAGALADPASGSTISVMMFLSNSSIIIGGE